MRQESLAPASGKSTMETAPRGVFSDTSSMISPATYIREALEELHHVRWPTRQQAVRLSVIVLGFVLCSSIAFGLLDMGLSKAVSFILPSA